MSTDKNENEVILIQKIFTFFMMKLIFRVFFLYLIPSISFAPQILFISGLACVIGLERTFRFFFQVKTEQIRKFS